MSKYTMGLTFVEKKKKKSKCSNQPFSLYLQDLFAVISAIHSPIPKLWPTSCHFTAKQLHKIKLSNNPVTLNEGKGHYNWHKTVGFCAVYHTTKFDTNWFIIHLIASQF